MVFSEDISMSSGSSDSGVHSVTSHRSNLSQSFSDAGSSMSGISSLSTKQAQANLQPLLLTGSGDNVSNDPQTPMAPVAPATPVVPTAPVVPAAPVIPAPSAAELAQLDLTPATAGDTTRIMNVLWHAHTDDQKTLKEIKDEVKSLSDNVAKMTSTLETQPTLIANRLTETLNQALDKQFGEAFHINMANTIHAAMANLLQARGFKA